MACIVKGEGLGWVECWNEKGRDTGLRVNNMIVPQSRNDSVPNDETTTAAHCSDHDSNTLSAVQRKRLWPITVSNFLVITGDVWSKRSISTALLIALNSVFPRIRRPRSCKAFRITNYNMVYFLSWSIHLYCFSAV